MIVHIGVGFCVACSSTKAIPGPQLAEQQQCSPAFFMSVVNNADMKQIIKTLYSRFRNLILYGIIGAFCASLDFVVYTLLCHFDLISYLWANVISIHAGIICSFLLNRTFNFKIKDKMPQRFLSFYLVGLVGLGISEAMLYIMVTLGSWNEVICKLISVVVVALIQFVLNKYITFNTKQS